MRGCAAGFRRPPNLHNLWRQKEAEDGAYIAGLVHAEVVEYEGRRVCFILEVLKNPVTRFRVFVLMLRHLPNSNPDKATQEYLVVSADVLQPEYGEKICMLALATPAKDVGWSILSKWEAERADLQCALSMAIVPRSVGNIPLPGSKSACVFYKITNDKGNVKFMDKLEHSINVAQLELKAWGKSGDWFDALINHPMRHADAPDHAWPLRNWEGPDGRQQQDEAYGPYLPMMEPLRQKGGLVVPHVLVGNPPKEYDETIDDANGYRTWTLVRNHDVGRPLDWDARQTCVTNAEFEAHGAQNLDLHAFMNLCDKETRFDLDCRSSPFHNTPHRDQSKLVKPIEIDSYLNVPDEIDKRHPNASASAKALMLESVMMVNDDTIDWQSVMLPPPTQKKMRPAKGKELLDFRTDLDTSEPGEELRRDVSHKRLILWPVIPDFGERQMDDVSTVSIRR